MGTRATGPTGSRDRPARASKAQLHLYIASAEALGIGERTLYDKLKVYGIK